MFERKIGFEPSPRARNKDSHRQQHLVNNLGHILQMLVYKYGKKERGVDRWTLHIVKTAPKNLRACVDASGVALFAPKHKQYRSALEIPIYKPEGKLFLQLLGSQMQKLGALELRFTEADVQKMGRSALFELRRKTAKEVVELYLERTLASRDFSPPAIALNEADLEMIRHNVYRTCGQKAGFADCDLFDDEDFEYIDECGWVASAAAWLMFKTGRVSIGMEEIQRVHVNSYMYVTLADGKIRLESEPAAKPVKTTPCVGLSPLGERLQVTRLAKTLMHGREPLTLYGGEVDAVGKKFELEFTVDRVNLRKARPA